jgi:hypothetical protein
MDHMPAPSLFDQVVRKRGLTAALWCIAAVLALLLFSAPTHAQSITIETSVEDSWTDEPVELTYSDAEDDSATVGAQRYTGLALDPAGARRPALANYGPFRVMDAQTVEMVGTVDSSTPAAFAAMLAAHTGIARLVMRECPGSIDEHANLMLARAVRRAGLTTHVPRGGSVRSGAVELWLAGARRTADDGAEFGVHSWRDEDGREARDYAASDPVHAEYLGFYREMGIADAAARRFYALTNSVGFDDLRVLGTRDMAQLGLLEGTGR